MLLSTIHPELAVDAKQIAEQVLTHEVISDSMLSHLQFLEKIPLLGLLIRRLRLDPQSAWKNSCASWRSSRQKQPRRRLGQLALRGIRAL